MGTGRLWEGWISSGDGHARLSFWRLSDPVFSLDLCQLQSWYMSEVTHCGEGVSWTDKENSFPFLLCGLLICPPPFWHSCTGGRKWIGLGSSTCYLTLAGFYSWEFECQMLAMKWEVNLEAAPHKRFSPLFSTYCTEALLKKKNLQNSKGPGNDPVAAVCACLGVCEGKPFVPASTVFSKCSHYAPMSTLETTYAMLMETVKAKIKLISKASSSAAKRICKNLFQILTFSVCQGAVSSSWCGRNVRL